MSAFEAIFIDRLITVSGDAAVYRKEKEELQRQLNMAEAAIASLNRQLGDQARLIVERNAKITQLVEQNDEREKAFDKLRDAAIVALRKLRIRSPERTALLKALIDASNFIPF